VHTVLVLGGYGNFGQTICRALVGDGAVRLIVAGRDANRASAFCDQLNTTPGVINVTSAALDCYAPSFAQSLVDLDVDTVVHTAGPFQQQNYAVALACISAGCNYIDLADARSFVSGIGALDKAARANHVLVVSGASSVPALSGAVVDNFISEFSELHSIRHGISSGAKTPGLATMQAVFGYCGKTFKRLKNGHEETTYGWQDTQLYRYPAPVGLRLMGSCDIPDLSLFPQRYPSLRTVTFHAGIGNPLAHLAVWALTWPVRWAWLSSLVPLVAPLKRLSEWLEFLGSDKSAMHVELEGLDQQGNALLRCWYLVATKHHGPSIPCGAAIALVRKIALGKLVATGATPCLGLLSLDEYLSALSGLSLKQVMR